MSLLGLCDDIQYLIGEQIKKQPRYCFNVVLGEIENYEYQCGLLMRDLIASPPFIRARQAFHVPKLESWWIFKEISRGDRTDDYNPYKSNWVVETYLACRNFDRLLDLHNKR